MNKHESPTDVSAARSDLRGHASRGSAWMIASQATRLVLNIVTLAILARLVAPEAFGIMAMATVATQFVMSVKDLGFRVASIQRADLTRDQMNWLFAINVIAGLLLSLALVLLAPAVGWAFNDARVSDAVIVLSGVVFIAAASSQHEAILQRQMRFGRLAVAQVVGTIVGNLLGIALAIQGGAVWALVLMSAATQSVTTVGVVLGSRWVPSCPRRGVRIAHLVRFAGGLTLVNTLNYVSRYADNVLIGISLGPAALGIYDRAYQLMMAPIRQINRPLGAVVISTLSKLAAQPERFTRAYISVLQKIALVTAPPLAICSVFAPEVIRLLLGPAWTEAIPVFAWLALAAMVQPVSGTIGWVFKALGNSRDLVIWQVVSTLSVVGAVLVGLPWGIEGIAAAYALSSLFFRTPAIVWWISRCSPVSVRAQVGALLPSALASVVGMVSALSLKSVPILTTLPWPVAMLSAGIMAALAAICTPAGQETIRHSVELCADLVRRRDRTNNT